MHENNINVVKISHTSFGNAPRNYCFKLFRKHRFKIICPNCNGTILKHKLETVLNCTRSNDCRDVGIIIEAPLSIFEEHYPL